MTDSVFNIRITAVDKATKVVNKVNKSVSQAFRPLADAKRSGKAFFDALGRNDLVAKPLWALRTVGKGVTAFGSAFGVAENSIVGSSARVAAALGTIGGPIGGLLAGAAAVVGGSTAVAVSMANMGQNISRTAKNLNIGTTELQEYRGAAKLAGLETQSMDSSLASLGTTLQDAKAGRNQMAAWALSMSNVHIRETKDGAVDTLAAFRDIADVVSHMTDQNLARKLTDMFGITDMLPLLRQGSGQLDQYIAKAHQVGAVMSTEVVQRNKEQADSWNETKTAIDGAGVSVGNLIAKYINLKDAASTASRVAEALSRTLDAKDKDEKSGKGGISSALTSAVPLWMDPFRTAKMLPYLPTLLRNLTGGGAVPEGPRSASGKVTDLSAAMSGSTRGLRNNNPGNLRSWLGAGSDGGYAKFPTAQAGLTAAGQNLLGYQDKHGINTIGGIVRRWAPTGDGNNVPAYIASLSKQTGFGANQPLNLHDPQVLAPLLSAITKQENGQNPYSPEVIAQAVAAAIRDTQGGQGERPLNITVQNVPAGMTVKPVRGLGQSTIGLAMAPGGMS